MSSEAIFWFIESIFLIHHHMAEGVNKLPWACFIKAPVSYMRAIVSSPNHFPQRSHLLGNKGFNI
jgi:hypothetical protein